MLIVLIATCEQALVSLEAVTHDERLDAEIRALVERCHTELRSLPSPS